MGLVYASLIVFLLDICASVLTDALFSPGRFFTVVVMKIMMTHIIMNYDVGLEKEGERPVESWFVTDNIPNDTARVLLRKRVMTTGNTSG